MLIFHRSDAQLRYFFVRYGVLNWQDVSFAGRKGRTRSAGKVGMNALRMRGYSLNKCIYFSDAPPNQRLSISHIPIISGKRTRNAVWQVVSFLIFDGLPQYPNCNDSGYWGKPLHTGVGSGILPALCGICEKNREKFYKSSQFGRVWYLCRGPPDCRCFHPFMQRQFRRKLCLILIAITH